MGMGGGRARSAEGARKRHDGALAMADLAFSVTACRLRESLARGVEGCASHQRGGSQKSGEQRAEGVWAFSGRNCFNEGLRQADFWHKNR